MGKILKLLKVAAFPIFIVSIVVLVVGFKVLDSPRTTFPSSSPTALPTPSPSPRPVPQPTFSPSSRPTSIPAPKPTEAAPKYDVVDQAKSNVAGEEEKVSHTSLTNIKKKKQKQRTNSWMNLMA
jgi:hypothetical protein